tara:strand:- start:141 stop:356 length:216 start_codon:yes stop_codon:yes gene_type:complete
MKKKPLKINRGKEWDWQDDYKEKIKCCICSVSIYKLESNNAIPVKKGNCCAKCNIEKVIPARIKQLEKFKF